MFEDTLELRPGKIQRTVRLSLPDFVVVLGIRKSDGKIPMVKQYRHGSGVSMWELPAGHVEPGERLIDSAKREFREETGFELWNRDAYLLSTPWHRGASRRRTSSSVMLGKRRNSSWMKWSIS